MAGIIVERAVTVPNIPKLVDFARAQLERKNVMLFFKDENLQQLVENVHWDGSVAEDWTGDYIMAVDANMGGLKSDYYMRRSMKYELDVTGEKPIATVMYTYKHTATRQDAIRENWRVTDYHSYLRLYVPEGAELIERKMVGYPYSRDEFGKTYFGVKVDVLLGQELQTIIKYELPERFKNVDDYKLLVQKQSGVDEIPLEITIRTLEEEFTQKTTLVKDAKFEYHPKDAE